MASKLTEIVIDCRDPRRLAQFWSDVLGWPLTEDDDGAKLGVRGLSAAGR